MVNPEAKAQVVYKDGYFNILCPTGQLVMRIKGDVPEADEEANNYAHVATMTYYYAMETE
jgi:hypothetical protein